jgi:hypothetical protein
MELSIYLEQHHVSLVKAKFGEKDRMKMIRLRCKGAFLICVGSAVTVKGLCHVQDRLEEAETRENQSREEGEKAKADLFQVVQYIIYPFLFDIEYDLHAL